MIRYSLKCDNGHSFDSWFQSADAYDGLAEKGLVSCPTCGSVKVNKAIMAPRIAAGSLIETLQSDPDASDERAEFLKALKDDLEKNSTYVGKNFVEEARAMHLGDAPEKRIHGEAKPEEAKALVEEGVPILPLPWVSKDQTH